MANCSTGRAHGRLGDRREFRGKPTLEPGQRFVAGSQDAGVFEQAAQMVGRFVRAGFVKALMGQRDVPGCQSGQQFLDPGRALPGQDAGGPLDTGTVPRRSGPWLEGCGRRRSSTRSDRREGRNGHRFCDGRNRLRLRNVDR